MITNSKMNDITMNEIMFLTKEKFTEQLLPKKNIDLCPRCESKNFIKYGRSNNSQRYMCNNCNKTFSDTTNTPRYYSKKGIKYWEHYISLMFEHTSLRESAAIVDINLKSAFIWRHKILHAIESMTETKVLTDCIEMRKLFIEENYKGNKNNIVNKRRKVWVIASSDCNDDTFAKPISLGFWKKSNFDKLVYSKISKDSYIKTLGDNYIKSIASKHNKDKVEKANPNSRALINHFIGNIKGIISGCHGVATKYLPHYFSLAKIISLAKECDVLELLNNISIYKSYVSSKSLKEIPLPFQLI